MDAQEATRTFKQAEALYANRRYEEALKLLENLDLNFPNTKNILYPKALCLAALGRKDEAATACDSLDILQDARAQVIRDQLRPAAGDEDLGMGLDADLLGDFDRPAPKRPVPVQAPNRMPLYAGIGGAVALVVIIGALLYTGVLGKLLPERETVESALEKIAAATSEMTACSGMFTAEGNITKPVVMKLTGSGDFDFLMKDDKPMFLINAAIIMEGTKGGMTQSFKIVCDGATMFQEMNMLGQLMVMKMPMPAGSEQQMNPAELMNAIKEVGEITLEKDETVDGMPAYVFTVKPSPTTEMPPGMPKLSDIKIVIIKETGMPALVEVKDEAGAMLLKAASSRIVVNSPSSPDKFKYTPPAGVQVMDMSDMQKMMPFPMPGM
ncbi:MAG TPA: CDC27 family protein [Candidatus Bathyarchaeia archaeon]|nr:CDC27 family protein [Candidatus Bathyarchaeia archaeon]